MLDIKQLGPQNNRKNLLKSQDVAYASAALEWIRFRFWFRFQFRIPRILHESSRIGQLRYLYPIDTRVSVRVCSCGNQQCSRSRSLSLYLMLCVSCCAIVDFPLFHFQFQFAWRIHNFPVTWRLHNAWRCRSCNTSKFRMQRSLEVELLQGCLQLDRTNNNNHFSISIIVLEIHISTTSTTG